MLVRCYYKMQTDTDVKEEHVIVAGIRQLEELQLAVFLNVSHTNVRCKSC